MGSNNRYEKVNYDIRLVESLDFVCKLLDVSQEDFVSLAVSNLLDEELDFIKNNGFIADINQINNQIKIVDTVKYEANGWVINRK